MHRLFAALAAMFAVAAFAQDHEHHPQEKQDQAPAHEGHGTHDPGPAAMHGALGQYPMTREGSGTSWLPDASPHEGIHATLGEWSTMTHGFANLIYVILLIGGALIIPVARYPAALRPVIEALPTAALGEGLRAAAHGQLLGWPVLVLLAWLVAAGLGAWKGFRWTS